MALALPGFADRLEPALARLRHYRPPTDREVDSAFAAHQAFVAGSASAAEVVAAWRRDAAPLRARLNRLEAAAYAGAGAVPRAVTGASFVITLRAVLAAGVHVQAALWPRTRAALDAEFPWLKRRHEHVPPGWTPDFAFPPQFVAFLDGGNLDDARARWQIITAWNEVQQTVYSSHLAELLRLPELERHAARELALAERYLAAWRLPVDREGLRQCLVVLDALNAAVFDLMLGPVGPRLLYESMRAAAAGEWRRFVAALEQPQWAG